MRGNVLLMLGVVGLFAVLCCGGCCALKEKGEKVTLDQVPPAVKATILEAAKGATVEKIKKEGKDDKVVYEAKCKTADGKKMEIKVDASGKLISNEMKGEKEKGKEKGKDKAKKGESLKALKQLCPKAKAAASCPAAHQRRAARRQAWPLGTRHRGVRHRRRRGRRRRPGGRAARAQPQVERRNCDDEQSHTDADLGGQSVAERGERLTERVSVGAALLGIA